MMKRIEVDISPGGGVTIDAVGFTGPDCEQATEFLEKALGQKMTVRRKPEYMQRRYRARTAGRLRKNGGL